MTALYGISNQILARHRHRAEFARAEAHADDDPDSGDLLWLTVVDEALTEGEVIRVEALSPGCWYVAHDHAHKYGGWPTVWDVSGSEAEVTEALARYLSSSERIGRTKDPT